ncbi:DUF805 domain-containing protein [Lactococcus cremoris]|uniref:DUF805 domain-containing protein n=1 Tax=Lactococcus lactis subsp. cremoris TaxID=1359 RepID=UPI001E462BFC|nr:DUF805 domain-containing protein [Lactococcus cremoris]
MFNAYKNFWRQSFDFKNRSSRSDYWWVFLINLIIYLVLMTTFLFSSGFSAALTADVDHFSAVTWLALILLIIWGLASIVPMSALAMRRIRDTGLSPFLWLVFPVSIILGEFTQIWAMIISGVLAIVYLIFTLLPSKPDKMKPNSQIKGSLIVTTGLLVLIIFSVGHLPAKAEQIVYGNPTQPVVNGEVNQSFVQRFNGAVILKNDKFIIDQSKVPKNATKEELKQFKALTENSTSVVSEGIKDAKNEGGTITTNNKAVVITEELSPDDPETKKLVGDDSLQTQSTRPNTTAITLLASKAPSKDRVVYRNEWWGSVGTSYSLAGTRKIINELTKWAKIATTAGVVAGVASNITLLGGPFAVPVNILVKGGAALLGFEGAKRRNAVGEINRYIGNGQANQGLRVQIDNLPIPNGYKVSRR